MPQDFIQICITFILQSTEHFCFPKNPLGIVTTLCLLASAFILIMLQNQPYQIQKKNSHQTRKQTPKIQTRIFKDLETFARSYSVVWGLFLPLTELAFVKGCLEYKICGCLCLQVHNGQIKLPGLNFYQQHIYTVVFVFFYQESFFRDFLRLPNCFANKINIIALNYVQRSKSLFKCQQHKYHISSPDIMTRSLSMYE